jgi:aminoglycoside 6'-N-acetyltransferase I
MSDQFVRQAEINDTAEIAMMCTLLWPDATFEEHKAETELLIRTRMCGTLPATIFVSEDDRKNLTGFLQVGLRSHADGCDPSHPVGYVEGWFVHEPHRRHGIGTTLVRAAEDWARMLGCKEMASDTWSDERSSLKAHEAAGFEIVDRCIHFRKQL